MPTENFNFNELWLAQKTEQPSAKDFLLKINAYKRKNRNKIILLNLILVLTSLFIVFIWYYFQPELITTKIGMVVVILSMVIFIISQNKSFALFKKTDETENNQHYLKTLLKIKAHQQFMQTTMMNLYFVLLSLGIALYLFEYASKMSLTAGLLTYGITCLWILFNWFYLRPKQIKKEQNKLNEIIAKVENIQNQLEEESNIL
ncbi:MAG: hypothetical protein EOP00_29050 [Pedobacter sp.]|nr:MAG: hypothetical protein EOP00_29050 [Pedobacter sp.]